MVAPIDFVLIAFGFILGFIANVGFYHYKLYREREKDTKLTNKVLQIELKQTIKFLETIEKRLIDSLEKKTFDEVIEYLKSDQATAKGSKIPIITEKIPTKVYDDRYSKVLQYTNYFSEEVIHRLTNFYNNRIYYLNDLRNAIEKIDWASGNINIAPYTLAYCINQKEAIAEANELIKSLPTV